jgi:hypothetical protein
MNLCQRNGNCLCRSCNANRMARSNAGKKRIRGRTVPVDPKYLTNPLLAKLHGKAR